jgi:hypothetical protein
VAKILQERTYKAALDLPLALFTVLNCLKIILKFLECHLCDGIENGCRRGMFGLGGSGSCLR